MFLPASVPSCCVLEPKQPLGSGGPVQKSPAVSLLTQRGDEKGPLEAADTPLPPWLQALDRRPVAAQQRVESGEGPFLLIKGFHSRESAATLTQDYSSLLERARQL